MAAAFFNRLANLEMAKAISAGTRPGSRVHPEVVSAMKELGIDLSDSPTTLLTSELARQATTLVTMGCAVMNARTSRVLREKIGRSKTQGDNQWRGFARFETTSAPESSGSSNNTGGVECVGVRGVARALPDRYYLPSVPLSNRRTADPPTNPEQRTPLDDRNDTRECHLRRFWTKICQNAE